MSIFVMRNETEAWHGEWFSIQSLAFTTFALKLPNEMSVLLKTRPVKTSFKIAVRHQLLTHNKTRLSSAYKKAIVKINDLSWISQKWLDF